MRSRFWIACVAGSLMGGGQALAQVPDLLVPKGDGILSGVLIDARGEPVAEGQLTIPQLRRSYRTMPDGSFWFDSIPTGTYQLSFRRIGFLMREWNVEVRAGGTALLLQVEAAPQVLEPVISRAARVGVGGIVMDTAKTVLAGAEVRLNGGRIARTDAQGRFFIGTPPGRYLLHVRHKGHATQFISVSIPRDSGAEVAVWLTPTTRGAAARESFVLENFRARMQARNPVWSRLFTRDELMRTGFTKLEQIAVAGSGRALPTIVSNPDGECMAIVDGLTRVPVWSVDAADIEFVEVYGNKPARVRRNIRTTGDPAASQSMGGCPQVYVWLRK